MTKDYRKMSIKEKEYANRQHGLPERCHECDVAVSPEDMAEHIKRRCPGRAPPHPNARWIVHGQALKMGVSKKELSELATAEVIRTKLKGAQKCYLVRDIAKCINAKAAKTKVADAKRKAKGRAKELTGDEKTDHEKKVTKSSKKLSQRIKSFAEEVGGFAPAGRKLDVPLKTLKRAASGENIRPATKLWIETELDQAGA